MIRSNKKVTAESIFDYLHHTAKHMTLNANAALYLLDV